MMLQNLNKFIDKMSDIDKTFRQNYFKSNPLVPPLYQYTDIRGLMGILGSGLWRATHSLYLNDGKEIVYADEMMSKIIEIRLATIPNGSILLKVYDDVINKKYGKPSVGKSWDEDFYVISMSKEGNLLDQWRAYADNGKGYSIGIDPFKLKYKENDAVILSYDGQGLGFVKVIYNPAEQERLIKDILDQAEQVISSEYAALRGKAPTNFSGIAAKVLSEIVWKLAVFYKHPAFENEQEWRVVKSKRGRKTMNGISRDSVKDVKYRESENKFLTPYIELDFTVQRSKKRIPLEQIYLGPKQNDPRAIESLKMYLSTLGYDTNKIDIDKSDIPYR